jgi:LysM repeat protein
MSRSTRHPRVSRGLIAILVVTIVLGVIAYFHNASRTKAAEQQKTLAASKLVKFDEPAAKAPADQPKREPAAPVKTTPAIIITPATSPSAAFGTAPTTAPPSTRPALAANVAPGTVQIIPLSTPHSTTPHSAPTPAPAGDPVAEGKRKLDAGDLLGARKVLNGVLLTGTLNDIEAINVKSMLSQISQTVVFSPKRFADDEFGGTYSVQPGNILQKIAANHDVTTELLCRLNGLSDPRRLRAGATLKVLKGPFHGCVTKHNFTMEIWLGEPYQPGSYYVTTFPVGLGRDDSTPTGKWMVEPQRKLKNPTYYSPRGEGVIAADDPKNPLGEFWIGLTGIDGHAVGKQSYGIHGTIEPDSIGKQSSMGCIRMHNEDVAQVFELLVEGKSTVTVRD